MFVSFFFFLWILFISITFAAPNNGTCDSLIVRERGEVSVLDYLTLDCTCNSKEGNRWYFMDMLVFWGKHLQDDNFPGNATLSQNYSLTFRSVQVQNDGTYQCFCNYCVTREFQLFVEVAPEIKIITSNQENSNEVVYFEAHKNYSIVCQALEAKPAVNLTFRINNEAVCNDYTEFYTSESPTRKLTHDSSARLWMQPVGVTGNVSCIGSAQLISAETEAYLYFVTYVTPRISIKINGSTLKGNVYVRTEEKLVVECTTGGARPSANLTLLIGGVAITDSNDTFITKHNDLFFSSVTKLIWIFHERVQFTCIANGPYGYNGKREDVLLIKYAAPFLNLAINGKTIENGTHFHNDEIDWMLAECHALKARPAVRLEWRISGKYMQKTSKPSQATENSNGTYDAVKTLSFLPQNGKLTVTCVAVGQHGEPELYYIVEIFTKGMTVSLMPIVVLAPSALFLVLGIFSALFYRRKQRGKRQQSISKENATTPSGFESYEEPQERRTNFQTMPLPALPDKKRESIEDENVYYSDENESFTNRRVFQQRDLSFVLRLNSGSIYDRWIITLSKQNKSRLSTYFVASTVTVGNAAQKQITHWNDFAKRILEIPDVKFVVKTRGICIDGGCLYLIQDHIMCQTLEKYQLTKEGSGQLPSVSEFEIMRFINDILKGMEFIHSYGFLHPGISRKKILLTNQGQCKLYNFCLNEDATEVSTLLKMKGDCSLNELPWETLMRNEYSQESDVWCTGVVIWEIFSGGLPPFSERSHDYVNFGHALMGPTSWPKQTRKLQNNHLFECWRKDPTLRPTISQLKDSFENIMTLAKISMKDIDLSNDYMPMGGNET